MTRRRAIIEAACGECSGTVEIETSAPQQCEGGCSCDWHAWVGDSGQCVECGTRHYVDVTDEDEAEGEIVAEVAA